MFFCQIVALDKSLIYIYTSICQLFQGFPLFYARRSQSIEEMAMSLQQAFSNLQPRDLLLCGPGVAFVVVRNIEVAGQERNVLGQLCSCHSPYDSEAHPETILPYAYAWNDGLSAFVDRDGDWLRGWSNEIHVERGAYRGLDLAPFAVVGVVDEYVGEDIAGKEGDELYNNLSHIATYSGSPILALVSTARLLGINLSIQQAKLISEVAATNVEGNKMRTQMAKGAMDYAARGRPPSRFPPELDALLQSLGNMGMSVGQSGGRRRR